MLLNKFEMPLDLVVNDSKILRLYFNIVFFLSFVSLFISSLALTVQLLLCIVLVSFYIFTFKKHNLNKIISIKLSRDDKWEIEIDDEKCYEVELQGECIVTYFIVWLNFTVCNNFGRKKRFHILLLPDSAEKDVLRRLRVRLRFFNNKKTEDEESVLRD